MDRKAFTAQFLGDCEKMEEQVRAMFPEYDDDRVELIAFQQVVVQCLWGLLHPMEAFKEIHGDKTPEQVMWDSLFGGRKGGQS